MENSWHVIECYHGEDGDVRDRLAANGWEVLRPVVMVRPSERIPGTDRIVRRPRTVPIFSPYLFVRAVMSDSVFGAVIDQRGVRGWVCLAGSDDPARVPEDLVDYYRSYKPQAVDAASLYGVGDRVAITGGPFVNREAVVVRVDSDAVLRCELDIFGRPTPLPIPVGLVTLLEQGRRPPTKRDDRERQRKRA